MFFGADGYPLSQDPGYVTFNEMDLVFEIGAEAISDLSFPEQEYTIYFNIR